VIRPRLTEHHGIFKPQDELDFAIPFMAEDIPLYVDPFLLWKSPSFQDQALHAAILTAFNNLGYLAKQGRRADAIRQLVIASECDENGLGQSVKAKGKRLGEKQAGEIVDLFAQIPQVDRNGFQHFEEIQFFVSGIAADRVSDIACSFMKSFLIDFTIDQCADLGIPLLNVEIETLYEQQQRDFVQGKHVSLPTRADGKPLILIPKRWLRFGTWLSFDDYFKDHCPKDRIFKEGEPEDHVRVLNFNRDNYGVVAAYVKEKERTAADCHVDPLFTLIPVVSAKRTFKRLTKLPTGKTGNADREYEDAACSLLASLLYPHLDFADDQARTDSGVLIRDLIFYNSRSHDFLRGILDEYGSKQLVFEMKNVVQVERDHINQLNRYLADDFGKFGVLVTRRPLPRAMRQNTIDLWSGQRRCIIPLLDTDLEQMVELFESKQRHPIDVVIRAYVEFRRECPA
jgi:hypothetical protein